MIKYNYIDCRDTNIEYIYLMNGGNFMGKKGNDRLYADIMPMHPEVTGSCFLVVVKLPNGETIKFVVDCGLFQEQEYYDLNEKLYFKPENVDFAVVTHNHIDHTGRLPLLVKKGFSNDIYLTDVTARILPIALKDTIKILKAKAANQNKKALYSDTDVSGVYRLLHPVKIGETIKVNEYVLLTFLSNGHLVGAAMVLVQISYPGYDSINILFTGDYNNKNIFFDVDPVPEWVRELRLTVVQESTYGYMNSTDIHKCFSDNVTSTLTDGGTVVVPVFSLGRGQEIMHELKIMQENNDLDTNIPIYFDGKLGIKYTELYLKNAVGIKDEMVDFLPKNITFLDKETRTAVLNDKEPKIILTTSGMGSYGPAQMYIPEYITHSKALIQFTGYTAEDTLGGRLKNTPEGGIVQVGGLILKKRARVEYTNEYSAHAKADEIIDFLNQFNNLKLVLFNHGTERSKQLLAEKAVDEVNAKYIGVMNSEYYYRVNPYGLVKNLTTKFR